MAGEYSLAGCRVKTKSHKAEIRLSGGERGCGWLVGCGRRLAGVLRRFVGGAACSRPGGEGLLQPAMRWRAAAAASGGAWCRLGCECKG